MEGSPELSIIIVSYDVRALLLNCIQSILETAGPIHYEIIVIDNASTDGSAEALRKTLSDVWVIPNKENVGYAKANNQGYLLSKGDFLLLLNPDTVVKPGAIKSVLEFMKNMPDAGIAACRLLNPDGSLQKSIRPLPSIKEQLSRALFLDHILYREYWKTTYYRPHPFEIGYCTGAFMMIRRSALSEMPLLNPEFFMYSEEKDLAFRLRNRGWKTYFVPSGEVTHFGEQSTRQMSEKMFLELQRSQVKFFKNNYSFFRARALALTWGLVLFSNLIISLPLILSSHRRRRMKLFVQAVGQYPFLLKTFLR
jgi:GT2 family glycosyltransferase